MLRMRLRKRTLRETGLRIGKWRFHWRTPDDLHFYGVYGVKQN